MLPFALLGTYQQYKLDTDSVAAWLASTAKSLGFPADLLSSVAGSATKPSTGGRLKGKARAQGKKQAAASSSKAQPPPSSTGPRYVIAIKDFTPLAEYIAEKAAPVPKAFQTTIERVITARSAFGSDLEQYSGALNEASDAKHRFFVGGKYAEALPATVPSLFLF